MLSITMVHKWQMLVGVALLTQSLRRRSARQQARQLEHARHAGREKGAGGLDESLTDSADSLHVAALENALRREKETVRRLRITLREQATEMKETLAAASRAKRRQDSTGWQTAREQGVERCVTPRAPHSVCVNRSP